MSAQQTFSDADKARHLTETLEWLKSWGLTEAEALKAVRAVYAKVKA